MAQYEPKTDSKEFELLNAGQDSIPAAGSVTDSADITIRLWQRGRPPSDALTWRTESVLVYMIADLVTASPGIRITHIPMLLDVPGWQRIRRFRLTGPPPLGDGLGFLSLHELAGPAVLSEPGYRAAVSTPWRDRVVSGALSRERRVLSFRNSFC